MEVVCTRPQCAICKVVESIEEKRVMKRLAQVSGKGVDVKTCQRPDGTIELTTSTGVRVEFKSWRELSAFLTQPQGWS